MLATLALAMAQTAQPLEPGFRALFDGKSLEGWVTKGGRYDGDAEWSVVDGCIVGRQGPDSAGGLLYTAERHASFELRLEVELDYPFDSGVFLRMAPEGKGMQVTLDWREGGEVGALYADGFLQHNEEGTALFREGWNDLRVRCTGFDMHVQAWLNGAQLCDFQLEPDSPGYAPTGLIGLQVHGGRGDHGKARFRNVRLRDLPLLGEELFTSGPLGLATLSAAAVEDGWKPLFDGHTLEGWEVSGERNRYGIEDGVLSFLARGGGGFLATREDYRDFKLRLDFRIAHMANSGLFLRAARDGSNPAFSGLELQILDDFNWETVKGTRLKPWQHTGSLYGSSAPIESGAGESGAMHPLGEWNTLELLYRGNRLAAALNGRTLHDLDTYALVPESGPPFEQRAPTGFIGLQHHGAEKDAQGSAEGAAPAMIAFRNLFIQPL